MGDVKLNSSGGGSVTLTPPSTASNLTVTLPSASGTMATTAGTETLTNKTLTAAGSNTVEATSGPTSSQLAGNRNKIINGAMMIDQRNAGASVTPSVDNTYTLDRYKARLSVASKFSVQQSTTAPVGYKNSLLVTSLATTSVGAGDFYCIAQPIEGFNIADLGFGAVGAASVTLSFWVRSSLTGTFGGALTSNADNDCYPFTYTINSANTFEQKTITIAGNTSGTWLTTNGVGLNVYFGLGVGSGYSGTVGTWSGNSFKLGTSTGTSVVGTNGATFYITGVQLEKGATATPFENRLYGTELALCQRYYRKTDATNPNAEGTIYGYGASTTGFVGQAVAYPVPMRASPTAAYGGTWVSVNSTKGIQAFQSSYLPFVTPLGAGSAQQYTNNSGFITFDAEL